MKKIVLIIVIALIATSCRKETTYTLKWNFNDVPEVTTDVSVIEVSKRNEVVKINPITNIHFEDEFTFTADEKTKECKIKIIFRSPYYEVSSWIAQVYSLNKGENTEIIIGDWTPHSETEP